MKKFEISPQTWTAIKHMVWGGFAGAILIAIIGAYAPGYSIESTIQKRVATEVSDAFVQVLGPVCAEKFRTDSNFAERSAALAKENAWRRYSFVIKGDYVIPTGNTSTDNDVGRLCATLLEKSAS